MYYIFKINKHNVLKQIIIILIVHIIINHKMKKFVLLTVKLKKNILI